MKAALLGAAASSTAWLPGQLTKQLQVGGRVALLQISGGSRGDCVAAPARHVKMTCAESSGSTQARRALQWSVLDMLCVHLHWLCKLVAAYSSRLGLTAA